MGQIQPATCFCVAHELRMMHKWLEEIKEYVTYNKEYVTYKNYVEIDILVSIHKFHWTTAVLSQLHLALKCLH